MSNYTNVTLLRDGDVATISINRPEIKNAVSYEDIGTLSQAFKDAAVNDAIKVIIFTGSGGSFCAGAELTSVAKLQHRIEDIITTGIGNLVQIIGSIDKPVIAAVEGHAAGVGMSMALACDLMLMAETARLYSPFAALSLVPDGGATWFLRQKLGYQRAYEFFIESQKLSAQECLAAGIANRVVADSELHAHAVNWAKEIAEKAPLSLSLVKRLLRRQLSLQETVSAEGEYQNKSINSQDFKEGASAFFEKRKPTFKGY